MIRTLVANPRFMIMAIALIVVAGINAFQQLAQTEDPAFSERYAALITSYPGGTAERVEAQISEPLESALEGLDEILKIESSSRPGFSRITIELRDNINNIDLVWQKIRSIAAEQQRFFPAGVLEPELDTEVSTAFTQILGIRWQGTSEPDLLALGRYGETLASQLRRVTGTDYVKIHGQPDEQISVALNDAQFHALGLSTDALAHIIAAADAKTADGNVSSPYVRAQVQIAGELDSLQRLRQLLLSSETNQQLRLGDIATIERTANSLQQDRVLVKGQPAILVAVRMLPNVRVDQWDPKVAEAIQQLQQQLPSNITIETLFNQRQYTEVRLTQLAMSMLQGFVLISAVLLITLGLRAALMVALALPLTLLITMSCMHWYGLPIHQMSVVGLVVALGIMVDNAIVIVDAIGHRKRQGLDGVTAVRQTLQHFWLPLLASTLTTVLAFAPIFLMPGPAGEFVEGIALSVSFALLASYALSHTLIAGLAGRFLVTQPTHRWWQQGIKLTRTATLGQRILRRALHYPKCTIAAVFCLPLTGFIAASQLPEQFFPPSDRDMFQIQLWLPAAASHSATMALTQELDQWLRQQPGIRQTVWGIGRTVPSFYYNLTTAQQGVDNFAQGMISADDYQQANRLITELQPQLSQRYPDVQVIIRKLEQGPPFKAPVELRLVGTELAQLRQYGEQLRQILAQQSAVIHTRSLLLANLPRMKLHFDEPALHAVGLSLASASAQIRGQLDGSIGGSLLEGPEQIPVRVQLTPQDRQGRGDLGNLQLITPNGQWVPLSALARIELEPALSDIPRRNGERINTIMAYLQNGVLPSTVLNQVQQQLATEQWQLPATMRLEVGGESAERDLAVQQLLSSVVLIGVALIAIIALSFNSFRFTAIILASAFQSIGLGLLAVAVAGYPFGFTVMIGLMGLMGLAINAAIVILAELAQQPQAKLGQKTAVINAVSRCGRHISSTTVTTVGGFLPLILAGGSFWPPFAIAIAGGTLLTTVLSFIFVPTAYQLLYSQRRQAEHSINHNEPDNDSACRQDNHHGQSVSLRQIS